MPKMKKTPKNEIYQLKITLKESKPPIWRRFQVRENVKLSKLHEFIQIVVGWENYHLHEFKINNCFYGSTDPEWESDMIEEKDFALNQLVNKSKERFTYIYDFGDNWTHEIVLEKILLPEKGKSYPRCIAGENACPPEDSGGLWGYYEKLEIIKNPNHPEYEEIKEWLPKDFAPEEFDLEEINKKL